MADLYAVRSVVDKQRRNKCGTYDAANHQEPDNHINSFCNLSCILSHFTVDSNLAQEFPADGQVEHGPNANGPEETNKGSLELMFDLMDIRVHREDDRQSTNKKDQNSQEYQTVDGDDVVVCK